MNTKSMRLPPRRVLTPTKRKEREDFDAPKPASTTKSLKPTILQSQAGSYKATVEPKSSNHLVAGYLAHEYLTKGTLFGEPFDPAGSQAVFPPVKAIKPGKKEESERSKGAERSNKEEEKYQRYVEVARLLKTDGAHIAGIVNPTQLARFLHK